MTRLSTTAPTPIRKPESILLGELAIAAGLAGRPVAVCFSESIATTTCEIWKYFTQFTGPEHVLHVHGQTDVRRLTKDVGHWRLVVVHTPRLFNTVAWTVQMHGSETSARPTIFSRSIPSAVNDVPIPMLVLRNTPDESSAIVRWLTAGCPGRTVLPDERPQNGITFDPALTPLTAPSHLPNARGPSKLRDTQLLAALLAGACLTGNTQCSPEPTDLPTCGQHEYDRVRRLLQSPLVNTADEPVDQLAVDMVDRANVYLELKCNAEFIYAKPSLCDNDDPIHRQRGSRTHFLDRDARTEFFYRLFHNAFRFSFFDKLDLRCYCVRVLNVREH